MPHAIRYSPTEWASCVLSVMSFAKNCSNAQNDSQNAPYDVNATAPNVLPVRNSHMPARSCASPPYASARPSTTGSPLSLTRPALNMLSTNVVSANAPSPKGPGSAVTGRTRATPLPEDSTLLLAVSPRRGSRAVVVPASIVASLWKMDRYPIYYPPDLGGTRGASLQPGPFWRVPSPSDDREASIRGCGGRGVGGAAARGAGGQAADRRSDPDGQAEPRRLRELRDPVRQVDRQERRGPEHRSRGRRVPV